MDVSVQMAVTFERLGCHGNAASVGRIARSLGIGNGTVTLYCNRVINALNSLTKDYIYWPRETERDQIASRIEAEYGVPDCVGYVDGTDVILNEKPHIDGEVNILYHFLK